MPSKRGHVVVAKLRAAREGLRTRTKLNFLELRQCEVRRIHILGTSVNKGKRNESGLPGAPCLTHGRVLILR
jgi:hypothetical protein